MPRAQWPLRNSRPMIEVALTLVQGGHALARNLLADTGAGTAQAGFELLLDEADCVLCGGIPVKPVTLGGAYAGSFPVYLIRVHISALAFDQFVPVVGVPASPVGFDGIACFRFLNRFSYGNFSDPKFFGLES